LIPAIVTLAGIAAVFGLLLSYASRAFAIEEDPRVKQILDELPGANCGACGCAGCADFAERVAKGEAAVNGCVPGGKDVGNRIAKIMGVDSVEAGEEMVPVVFCIGDSESAHKRFDYDGVRDCNAALRWGGGEKACEYGCLGYGSCVKACPFDAMYMGKDGLPKIIMSRCTGCGICAGTCPRDVIKMVPKSQSSGMFVLCNSHAKGKDVRKQCEVGCIACKACVKACDRDAITVENDLAVIDRSKCDDCGACVEKCPRPVILMNAGVGKQHKQAV